MYLYDFNSFVICCRWYSYFFGTVQLTQCGCYNIYGILRQLKHDFKIMQDTKMVGIYYNIGMSSFIVYLALRLCLALSDAVNFACE